jgi:glycosyltransferase involved in cell wall biosynthesis
VRLTARRAAFAFATSQETERRLNALGCKTVSVFSEAGLQAEEVSRPARIPLRQASSFRLLTLGRLLHWKGVEFGLRAFARFKSRLPEAEYCIIGDGPERKRLMRVAEELSVAGSVTFLGAMPRWQVMEKLRDCDVLVHPSLHDSGGWVCLEAMAAGLPVVCLDLGGPALQVTEETGIKVPAIAPEQAERDLADAIYKLARDLELRARLGVAARKRVEEHFNWDRKGLFMAKLYHSLANAKDGLTAETRSLA